MLSGGLPIETALGLLGVIALIAAHGAFVAGEFGLVAADRASIEAAAEDGNFRARGALAALKSLSFQLSGAQLGITVTSLLVGVLIEPAVAPVVEPLFDALGVPEGATRGLSITTALVLATATEMVLAELIPKNIAIARPVDIALMTANPLRFCNALFRPVIVLLNASANFTVRLFGIEPREELIFTRSIEELELLVRSSREAGALQEEEYALLARSISFAERTAADALVPRTSIVAVQRDKTLEDLAEQALESGHSRFPVYGKDLDDVLGVAHIKDSFRFSLEERPSIPVNRITSHAPVVPESRDLESLLVEMRRERKQMAIVVDEYGGTAGVITIEDILEEIVGEIEDEYDAAAPAPDSRLTTPMPQGVHILSGLLHREETKEACGFEIPEGPYDTLAGFLLSLFARVPEPGDHVSYEGSEFKVLAMDGKRIDRVLVVGPSRGDSSHEAER